MQDKSCTPRTKLDAHVDVRGEVGAGQVLHPTYEGVLRWASPVCGWLNAKVGGQRLRDPDRDAHVDVRGEVGAGQVLHPTAQHGAARGCCRASMSEARSVQDKSCTPRSHVTVPRRCLGPDVVEPRPREREGKPLSGRAPPVGQPTPITLARTAVILSGPPLALAWAIRPEQAVLRSGVSRRTFSISSSLAGPASPSLHSR